jgi:hypothetical protein
MITILLDKDRGLLTECLVHKKTINGAFHVLSIDRWRPVILEKCRDKVKNRVLLFHKNDC